MGVKEDLTKRGICDSLRHFLDNQAEPKCLPFTVSIENEFGDRKAMVCWEGQARNDRRLVMVLNSCRFV